MPAAERAQLRKRQTLSMLREPLRGIPHDPLIEQ
jgi:hypothetical protein